VIFMRTTRIWFLENRLSDVRLVTEILSQFSSRLSPYLIPNYSYMLQKFRNRAILPKPAAILLSHHMPDLSAIEPIAKIMQEFDFSPPPIYVLGDQPTIMVEEFWKQQGARAYIEWALRPSDLKAALGRIAKEIVDRWGN